MKVAPFAGLALLVATLAAPARADDKSTCLEAASRGQKLRDAHALLEARDQLRICAAATCPPAISSDCTGWLADVEGALPTVVVTVKSATGVDLFDVKVAVDGQPFLAKLDGRAAPMNAGPHTFHFEGADGTTLDRPVMVREGEKNQEVAVVLGTPPPAPASPEPSQPTSILATPAADSGANEGPWRTIGWIAGAAGLVGLGVGTGFGLVALHDKNSAGCDASQVCAPGTTGDIKSAALVSDIGWIAGGVLLAGGVALVLFAPHGHASAATTARIGAALVPGGGGAVLGGAW